RGNLVLPAQVAHAQTAGVVAPDVRGDRVGDRLRRRGRGTGAVHFPADIEARRLRGDVPAAAIENVHLDVAFAAGDDENDIAVVTGLHRGDRVPLRQVRNHPVERQRLEQGGD